MSVAIIADWWSYTNTFPMTPLVDVTSCNSLAWQPPGFLGSSVLILISAQCSPVHACEYTQLGKADTSPSLSPEDSNGHGA